MNTTRLAIALSAASILLGTPAANAQNRSTSTVVDTSADNTRNNKEPSNKAATADDQKNDKTDLMLTKHIRASVVADKSLSTYAHNIKIVSVSGNVTLNGVVRSQDEKDAVASKAQAVIQGGSLVNNLKVAPAP